MFFPSEEAYYFIWSPEFCRASGGSECGATGNNILKVGIHSSTFALVCAFRGIIEKEKKNEEYVANALPRIFNVDIYNLT